MIRATLIVSVVAFVAFLYGIISTGGEGSAMPWGALFVATVSAGGAGAIAGSRARQAWRRRSNPSESDSTVEG